MMPLGFLIMLPLVGFAEETGWRGFLQPMLEKRFPFPVATTIVAVIWYD
ncbi:CPBP family intramembrane metalloprotease [Butyrivibrio sp. CB08]|nr:CPBP family intramembrane metalloprotease [Butyrivibrio sp. CB08]